MGGNCSIEEMEMNRRNFTKLAALGSLAVITTPVARKLSFLIPGDIPAGGFVSGPGGNIVKKTGDGRIMVSADGGLTWDCGIKLGPNMQVRRLAAAGGGLSAGIGFPGGDFDLVSEDGIIWRTIG
jgi:hypothetical protein